MSLGIAFKGPEGIVLAADSRVTIHAEKLKILQTTVEGQMSCKNWTLVTGNYLKSGGTVISSKTIKTQYVHLFFFFLLSVFIFPQNAIGQTLCRGDLNNDGTVNLVDFNLFKVDWGRADCDTTTPCQGDLNGDGTVNLIDFNIFKKTFIRIPSIQSNPGPTDNVA